MYLYILIQFCVFWHILDMFLHVFFGFFDIFGSVKKRDYQNVYEKLDDEKKKKVVKLICMVKGQKIEEEKLRAEEEIHNKPSSLALAEDTAEESNTWHIQDVQALNPLAASTEEGSNDTNDTDITEAAMEEEQNMQRVK